MSILPLLSSPFMNDKLIYHTTILLNNSQGGNAFWLSYLDWTVIGEESNTAFRNSLFWPEVFFHRHRNEWLSNPTVDLKYPLEFGLSTSALSICSTFAYTTPFHGNLRLQIIIITIFRKKTIIILLLLLKIRDKNK